MEGQQESDMVHSKVGERAITGYRLERQVDFYTLADFHTTFGVTAKEANVPCHTVTNDSGMEETGVIIDRKQPVPRVLTLFSEVNVSCGTRVLEKEFRPNQAKEVASWYQAQHCLRNITSAQDVEQRVEAIKKAAAVKLEQERMQAAISGAESLAKEKEDDEEPAEERQDRVQATPFDIPASQKGSKAKAKPKTKSKAGASSDAPRRNPKSILDDAASTRASSIGGASAKSGGTEKQMKKYTSELKLWDIMQCETEKTKGQVLWQAGTTMAAWKKSKATAPETLILSSLVGLARKANALTKDVIGKLTAQQRNSYLEEITEKQPSLPPQLQSSLLVLCTKELDFSSETGVANFIAMIFPLGASDVESLEPFDFKQPRLSTSSLDADQKAMTLQSMITEAFSSLIVPGETQERLLRHAAGLLPTHFEKELQHTEENQKMTIAAIEDAKTICQGLLTLLGTGSDKEGMQAVEDLAASTGGSKFLVYQARAAPHSAHGILLAPPCFALAERESLPQLLV